MDEDDDLEMLRLAALKSLKKENGPTATTAIPTRSVNKIQNNHVIPVVSHVRSGIDKYYVAPGAPELVQPNLIHHPVSAYIDSGFEKMDLGDPYVPQRLNPPTASQQQQPLPPLIIPPAYPDFNTFAAAATDSITNVQLSPRSAAFVYENKQIIKRRQATNVGPPSPPSPPANPFRVSRSPARWSRSPTPDRYHRRSRSPAYHHNRSSLSRSPQRRHSPQLIAHARRNRSRSRSPLTRSNFDANVHRSERRTNNASPVNRHGQRQWRAHSPPPTQQHQYGGMHARKSNSPRNDDSNARRPHRTRSPNAPNGSATAHFRGQPDNRRRTSSRSPNRKNSRLANSNRGRRATPPQSQQTRFNNSNGNKAGHGGGGRNRNTYNSRRPGSPATQNRRSSNSPQNHYRRRSPAKIVPMENGDTSIKQCAKDDKESKMVTDQNERSDLKPSDNTDASNEPAKTGQQIEDELLASTDSENSDNEESDGIDLFASEESESENEGRFKLSSSKSERKTTVPTLSFSELGKTTTAPADVLLRDLDEMQTDAMHSQSRRGGGRRETDRSVRSRHDRRKFNSRDRDSRSTNRDRHRERDRDARGQRRASSKSKVDSTHDKTERKSTTLKSTLSSISDNRTKPSSSGKCQ